MSEKPKWTPGPWRVVSMAIGSMTRHDIVAGDLHGNEFNVPVYTEDNARLIAAAPEMAEALRALLDDVDGYGLKHPEANSRFEPESAENARAALRKAGLEV